jgi:hypothetical protein
MAPCRPSIFVGHYASGIVVQIDPTFNRTHWNSRQRWVNRTTLDPAGLAFLASLALLRRGVFTNLAAYEECLKVARERLLC